MKQIKILRSGCQVSYKEILHISNRYIIYASTLAIYVLNSKTFVLEKVFGVTDKQSTFLATSLGFVEGSAAHKECKTVIDKLYQLFQ